MRAMTGAMVALVMPGLVNTGHTETAPPNVQALQQTVLKLTGEALDWQTRAIALQQENEELKKQLQQRRATDGEPAAR